MKSALILIVVLLPATFTAVHAVDLPLPAQTVPAKIEIADGPFKPTWDSLKQYKCPEWFRDAKFGIWAHWGVQCVPGQGDWYAWHMYRQGARVSVRDHA